MLYTWNQYNTANLLVIFQLLSHVWLFETLWTSALQVSRPFTISWNLFKLSSVESVMPSNHLICHPFLLLPSIFPNITVYYTSVKNKIM